MGSYHSCMGLPWGLIKLCTVSDLGTKSNGTLSTASAGVMRITKF
jgi:hypothetical protein